MKKYIKPIVKVVNVSCGNILAGSTGTLGRGYTSDDVSYGRGNRRGNLTDWDDDED